MSQNIYNIKYGQLQIQESNAQLLSLLKEKEEKILRQKEVNKALKKDNKDRGQNENAAMKEELEGLKTQLASKEQDFEVILHSFLSIELWI